MQVSNHVDNAQMSNGPAVNETSGGLKSARIAFWNFPWGEPLALLRNVIHPQPVFNFDGRMFPYFMHSYHGTYRNERAIEIPIILGFIKGTEQMLEVGNVLNHYVALPHDTVDKYEKFPGVINEDVTTYAPDKTYDLIVSISTLEHVGWDETPKDPRKFYLALDNMRRLTRPGGRIIFTIPFGWNEFLDAEIFSGRIPASQAWYMKRTGIQSWAPCNLEEIKGTQFGTPFWCANALMIGEITVD